LDGHGYSPTILHRILHIAGVTSVFEVAGGYVLARRTKGEAFTSHTGGRRKTRAFIG
jgi:hypothetical protein